MGSLYRRALDIYNHRPHLRLLRPEEKTVIKEEPLDIEGPGQEAASDEQEEKILADLDRAVSESRMRIDEETFSFQPKKKGGVLPLAVNLGAILLVAGAVYGLSFFFDRDQAQLVMARNEITSAEGQLLAAVRSESEAALSAKDREIANIRDQLVSINEEWETAQAEAQSRLESEEARLRAEIEAELEAERARLVAEGRSEAEIEEAIAEFAAQQEAELARRLSEVRSRLQEELAEQEQSFLSLQSEFEVTLQEARQERLSIQAEAEQRIARLNQELAEQEGRLAQERQEAATQLSELQSTREREALVLDQLIARYQSINELVGAGQYDEALEQLDALRDYLQQPSVVELPAIQRRLSTETFIISTIEDVIAQRQRRETAPTLADAALIERLSTRVAEANALLEAGDREAATQLYQEAVSQVPAVATAVQRLEEAGEIAETERLAAAETAIAEGGTLLAQEEYEGSLEQFRTALVLLAAGSESNAQQLADGIISAGSEILRAENSRLQDELSAAEVALAEAETSMSTEEPSDTQEAESADIGPSLLLQRLDQIEARLVESAWESTGPREDLASLLQAKVVTRRILNTEPTRSRYPGLGTQLDGYFDALTAESEVAGRQRAMVDLASALEIDSQENLAELSEAELWRSVFARIEELATTFPETADS